MIRKLKRFAFMFTMVSAAAAVYDQLRREPIDRSWHGTVFGFVPYDFRPPNTQRLVDAWWNPEDSRLFTPRDFGVGWALNLHRVYRLLSPAQDAERGPQTADS